MSKYGHSAPNTPRIYSAVYLILYVAEKNGSSSNFFFSKKRTNLFFVINVLNNKTNYPAQSCGISQKAFHIIDHSILVRKLCNYGIDQTSLSWLKSYLCDRIQKCRVNGHLSNSASVSCGAPQGSNLGALLF